MKIKTYRDSAAGVRILTWIKLPRLAKLVGQSEETVLGWIDRGIPQADGSPQVFPLPHAYIWALYVLRSGQADDSPDIPFERALFHAEQKSKARDFQDRKRGRPPPLRRENWK